MTLKTRRFLFYGLFLLFIVAGAGVVLYSQGWRINSGNCEIKKLGNCLQKTGGIYIETEPRNADIKIDGKAFPNRSGIIQKGTLISDLLPKDYKAEIAKEGYLPYYKNLSVKPEMVTELLKVVLIPQERSNETTLVSGLKGDVFIDKSQDDKKFIVKDSASGIYRLYDLNNLSSVLNLNFAFNNLKKENINKIVFHPFDSGKFIVKTKSGLYILDSNRVKLETAIQPLPFAWVVKNPNIYFVAQNYADLTQKNAEQSKRYILYSFNLVVKTKTELVSLPADAGEITNLDVSDSHNKIALLNNLGDIFIFNQSDKSFQKIAHNAKGFVFSPDNKKVAILDNNGRITVYFLEDFRESIDKKAGDAIRFDLKDKSSIKAVSWYKDSYHLFIEYPGKIQFIEIDDRSPLNLYEILTGASEFFYSPISDKIYFTRRGSFYSFGLEK